MFKYEKRLQYPIKIKSKDLKMAKLLITQYGGPNGELSAALRYFNQHLTMPDENGKMLLTDIATEEFGHVEMMYEMVKQILNNATLEDIKREGLESMYAEHKKGLFPTDSNGVMFTSSYFASTGDFMADLEEDLAAEEKARAVYENLIDLAETEDIIGPLLWLRQREIIHYNRFNQLKQYYKKKYNL